MQDCYWSLFNQRDRSRFDGLRSIQARAIVKSIPVDQRGLWLAWKEGELEWRALTSFDELFREETHEDSALPATVTGGGARLSEFTASSMSFAPENGTQVQKGLTRDEESVVTGSVYIGAKEATVMSKTRLADKGGDLAGVDARTVATTIHADFADINADSDFNTADIEQAIEQANQTRSFNKSLEMEAAGLSKTSPPSESEQLPSTDGVFDAEKSFKDFVVELDHRERSDKRKYSRYLSKLDVAIEIGRGNFIHMKTKDISIGGIRLAKALPPEVKKHINARLSRAGESLIAMCECVADDDGRIHRLKFLSVDRVDLLRTWLLSPTGG